MLHLSKLLNVFKRASDAQPVDSKDYWERRYASGGTSGDGSYGRLAEFKAEILNGFVHDHGIASVIEFGCGDGNQLRLAHYPRFIGLDVSSTAVAQCVARFSDDPTKSFFLYEPYCFMDNAKVLRAELSLSIDVIFHLIEDDVFARYMLHLFGAASRYVIIYSWGKGASPATLSWHNRPRDFESFVDTHLPAWKLVGITHNKYPYDPATEQGSLSSFYIYSLDGDHLA